RPRERQPRARTATSVHRRATVRPTIPRFRVRASVICDAERGGHVGPPRSASLITGRTVRWTSPARRAVDSNVKHRPKPLQQPIQPLSPGRRGVSARARRFYVGGGRWWVDPDHYDGRLPRPRPAQLLAGELFERRVGPQVGDLGLERGVVLR